ncbi:MAG: VOC family protein [Phyllobacterium sp.]
MQHPSYILLHVDNPEASGAFYTRILALQPVEASATFVLFVLDTHLRLGLWSRHTVKPASDAGAGAVEIGFSLSDARSVDDLHRRWESIGVEIVQEPTDMDFGRAFTACDPDGHRLRVFAPGADAGGA